MSRIENNAPIQAIVGGGGYKKRKRSAVFMFLEWQFRALRKGLTGPACLLTQQLSRAKHK